MGGSLSQKMRLREEWPSTPAPSAFEAILHEVRELHEESGDRCGNRRADLLKRGTAEKDSSRQYSINRTIVKV